jgi:hypothetical protein
LVSDGSSGEDRLSTVPATAGDASIFASSARGAGRRLGVVSGQVDVADERGKPVEAVERKLHQSI